ncbi:hypothetical protein K440DRAFT_468026, partial [Wilcoxina mikolae CBS 423.85]
QTNGDLDYLNNAVHVAEEILAEAPSDHCITADDCKNLSDLFEGRYQQKKDLDDLQAAITWAEQGPTTNHKNIDEMGCSRNLMACLLSRYQRTGELEDLREALKRMTEIQLTQENLQLSPGNSHTIPASCFNNLDKMLYRRYFRMRKLDDIQKAITFMELSVAATPVDHPDRALCLATLAMRLNTRFEQRGNLDDLQQAILHAEEAVITFPINHSSRAAVIDNLSNMLYRLYERTGILDDLQQAILRAEEAVAATPLDHRNGALYLSDLSVKLCRRSEVTGDQDDLRRAITHSEEALAACPLDFPERMRTVMNLASMLLVLFQRTGNLNDLQQAILRAEEVVAATSLDNPDHAICLGNLSMMLTRRFERTGDLDDLQRAKIRAEEVVATSSPNRPDHPMVLNNLGLILGCLFDRTGNPVHLQQAILRAQEALSALPLDHPERVNYCNKLCNMLALRYQLSGDIDDLKQAMLQTEEAVTAFPLEHPKRASAISTLSSLLRVKFSDTNDLDALQQAIMWAEEAVNAFPLDHPDRAVSMKHLGMLLNSRYEHAANPHDHERAIQCFRECVAQHSANPTERIHASTLVAFILDKDKKWADASEIRGIGVNLLARVSSRSLGRKDQQHMIKQFYTGLASDAAAAAVQAGKSASDAHPQIANEFEQLRDQLDSSNFMPSNAAEITAQGFSRRHTASLEMDKTIDRIRQLPNFERFLLPPTADELMMAVGPLHPVVLINISPIRCDAFLIQQQDITVLNLPRLHERTINVVASVMRSRSPTKDQMLDLLKWLWDVMAGPVLDQLGFREAVTTEESQWPRVCWIPTGSLCALPIHAAGYHDEVGSRTVLDRVISSYSPSIKALLYGRRNTAQRNPNRGRAYDKTVLVSMRTTPGCGGLAFAGEETKVLNNLLPSSIPRMTLHEPHKQDVLTALDGCSVFHFAGHGLSDPSDPSMSTLLLDDWQTDPLTVKDLVAMKFHQNPPLLAYLSACWTADNKDMELLNEGIHLMGACQLAGFRHVIGSLWEVSDKHCVDAAKDVYKTMIQAGMCDESVSQGLHNAVLNLR